MFLYYHYCTDSMYGNLVFPDILSSNSNMRAIIWCSPVWLRLQTRVHCSNFLDQVITIIAMLPRQPFLLLRGGHVIEVFCARA